MESAAYLDMTQYSLVETYWDHLQSRRERPSGAELSLCLLGCVCPEVSELRSIHQADE
jgi:hypothetical protein